MFTLGTSLVVGYDKMFGPFGSNPFSLYPCCKAQSTSVKVEINDTYVGVVVFAKGDYPY